MPKKLLNQPEIDHLAQTIQAFTQSTEISTAFLSLDGLLIHTQTVQSGIQRALNELAFIKSAAFPLLLNNRLLGFFICDAFDTPIQRLVFCRQLLEGLLTAQINDSNQIVVVGELLSDTQLAGLLQFSQQQLVTTTTSQPTPTSVVTTPIASRPVETQNTMTTLKNTLAYIDQHLATPTSLDEVAKSVYLSSSYLSRLFKKHFNITFTDYVTNRKIALAQELLVTTSQSIKTIAGQLGFSQTSYFTQIFKRITGNTPLNYRKQNNHVSHVYTVPRLLNVQNDDSVYTASIKFFNQQQIPFTTQLINGYPFIGSINHLDNHPHQSGWVYLVDCQQPPVPASEIPANNVSVIQWFYTDQLD